MGRPRIANPKNKHIGIVTTEEKYRRFKALGLVGDEAIDVLLYHLENENMELNIKKSQIIRRIRSLKKQIEELELEVLKEETKLDQINSEMGFSDNGLGKDVDSAINNVLTEFNKQNTFDLVSFLEWTKNKPFLENQAGGCGKQLDEFKELVIEYSEF